MKTNIKNILGICIFCTAIMPSCKKDFLDKNPLDQLSTQTFWKSDGDVQQALAGVYASMQGTAFYGDRKPWLDCYSDNAYDVNSYYRFDILTQGIINSTNVPANFYNDPYRCIGACNYFLDNVGNTPIAADVLNKYTAEVRFLRAMFYFDLVQAYGDVIVYKTTPPSVDASKIAKTSKDDVLAFIHDDLDFAIANLPDEAYDGHAVKGSAEALKARVAMFQQDWTTAAALTNTIITSGKFSISASYTGLFDSSATQQNNPGILFSTKYLAPNNTNNLNLELGNYNSVQPYQNLVDEYETSNGKRITDPASGYDPANPYKNRDPRLGYTLSVPGDTIRNLDGTVYYRSQTLTGYSSKKYVNFAINSNVARSQGSDQNMVLIRYADVLLMYAEAKNELSGPDASIYDALNQIRQRPSVNMPPVDETKYNTQSALREFIRHERRVEMALEGWRYYDLKRWGIMEQKLSAINNPGGVQLKFGEFNNVLPFALGELTANPQLKQNDGY